MSDENPKIRSDIIDDLFNVMDKTLIDYMTKHDDITNEEVHVVFYRLDQARLQQPAREFTAMYIYDQKKEAEEENKKKGKNMKQYG